MPERRVINLPELIGQIPTHLGFQPTRSLVVIITVNGRIVVTARHDLPAANRHQADKLAGWIDTLGPLDATGEFLIGIYPPDRTDEVHAEGLLYHLMSNPKVCTAWMVQPGGDVKVVDSSGAVTQIESFEIGFHTDMGIPDKPAARQFDAPWNVAEARRLHRAMKQVSPEGATAAWSRALVTKLDSNVSLAMTVQLAAGLLDLDVIDALVASLFEGPDGTRPDPRAAFDGQCRAKPAQARLLMMLRYLDRLGAALADQPDALARVYALAAWADWARGHGTRAAATLDAGAPLGTTDPLCIRVRALLDSGRTPLWLKSMTTTASDN